MTRTWTPSDNELLAIATTERLVVALDFDGTASPHVDEPMDARALPAVSAQIDRLTALPDTIVAYVSGRSMVHLREISEHSDDSPIALVGSHGAQYWYPGEGEMDAPGGTASLRERDEMWAVARPILEQFEGVILEEKTFGMGVHARQASPEAEGAAFAAIDALVQERYPHWRRRPGHHIREYASRTEGKDTAIKALREKYRATGILFAGDDVTDEDAMRVLEAGDLGVRVGPGESAAALRVANPQEIADLLGVVADMRGARQE